MAFKLTSEANARVEEYRQWAAKRRQDFEAMNDESLIASVKLYMSNMTPLHWAPGEPVYDATMWHIILPELMRRIKEK